MRRDYRERRMKKSEMLEKGRGREERDEDERFEKDKYEGIIER